MIPKGLVGYEGVAIDVIEGAIEGYESGRYGWTQIGGRQIHLDGSESRCIIASLVDSVERQRAQEFRELSLGDVVRFITSQVNPPPSSCSLIDWNDAKGRKKEEIIDALKLAAKELRNTVGA